MTFVLTSIIDWFTDRFGKAAVMDSRRLRNLSPSRLEATDEVGPLVVDDCRRIHGKLPKAKSTKDSRRPVVGARDRALLFEPMPPPNQ